jgi:hypothetical protein
VNLTAGGSYFEHWSIWIDFNQDGVFDDASERVLGSTAGKGTVAGNISIPTGHDGLQTRMRVAMKYSSEASSACGALGDGEAEDYTVTISGSGTGGRLEAGVAACVAQSSAVWLSLGEVNTHQTVAITTGHATGHATGDLDIIYKNGNTTTECIDLASGTDYWSYLKLSDGASNATIMVDFDAPGCRTEQ